MNGNHPSQPGEKRGPLFVGNVECSWLQEPGEDRQMQLTKEVFFLDSRGRWWLAPAGAVINGASIPRFAGWSLIGSPFTGDYRRASVLHDVACEERTRPHAEVHRMFYEAMLCDGVAPWRARLMYAAVAAFGPKWKVTK